MDTPTQILIDQYNTGIISLIEQKMTEIFIPMQTSIIQKNDVVVDSTIDDIEVIVNNRVGTSDQSIIGLIDSQQQVVVDSVMSENSDTIEEINQYVKDNVTDLTNRTNGVLQRSIPNVVNSTIVRNRINEICGSIIDNLRNDSSIPNSSSQILLSNISSSISTYKSNISDEMDLIVQEVSDLINGGSQTSTSVSEYIHQRLSNVMLQSRDQLISELNSSYAVSNLELGNSIKANINHSVGTSLSEVNSYINDGDQIIDDMLDNTLLMIDSKINPLNDNHVSGALNLLRSELNMYYSDLSKRLQQSTIIKIQKCKSDFSEYLRMLASTTNDELITKIKQNNTAVNLSVLSDLNNAGCDFHNSIKPYMVDYVNQLVSQIRTFYMGLITDINSGMIAEINASTQDLIDNPDEIINKFLTLDTTNLSNETLSRVLTDSVEQARSSIEKEISSNTQWFSNKIDWRIENEVIPAYVGVVSGVTGILTDVDSNLSRSLHNSYSALSGTTTDGLTLLGVISNQTIYNELSSVSVISDSMWDDVGNHVCGNINTYCDYSSNAIYGRLVVSYGDVGISIGGLVSDGYQSFNADLVYGLNGTSQLLQEQLPLLANSVIGNFSYTSINDSTTTSANVVLNNTELGVYQSIDTVLVLLPPDVVYSGMNDSIYTILNDAMYNGRESMNTTFDPYIDETPYMYGTEVGNQVNPFSDVVSISLSAFIDDCVPPYVVATAVCSEGIATIACDENGRMSLDIYASIDSILTECVNNLDGATRSACNKSENLKRETTSKTGSCGRECKKECNKKKDDPIKKSGGGCGGRSAKADPDEEAKKSCAKAKKGGGGGCGSATAAAKSCGASAATAAKKTKKATPVSFKNCCAFAAACAVGKGSGPGSFDTSANKLNLLRWVDVIPACLASGSVAPNLSVSQINAVATGCSTECECHNIKPMSLSAEQISLKVANDIVVGMMKNLIGSSLITLMIPTDTVYGSVKFNSMMDDILIDAQDTISYDYCPVISESYSATMLDSWNEVITSLMNSSCWISYDIINSELMYGLTTDDTNRYASIYANERVTGIMNGTITPESSKYGIYRSLDSGKNWTQVLSIDGIKDFNYDGDVGLSTSTSGIRRTTNRGRTWSLVNSLNSKGITTNDVIWMVITESAVYKSDDEGTSWTVTKLGFFNEIDNNDGSIWIIVGDDVFISRNNGYKWDKINIHGSFYCVQSNKDSIWFIGGTNGIWRSKDNGATWIQVSDLLTRSITTDNNGKWYAGTKDGLIVSTDDGVTWNTVLKIADIPSIETDGDKICISNTPCGILRSDDLINWAPVDIINLKVSNIFTDGNGIWLASIVSD